MDDEAKALEVARTTFTALLSSGGLIHSFSLAVVVADGLLGAALALRDRPAPALATAALGLSVVAAVAALHHAVRVRVDAKVFDAMARSRAAGTDLETGREAGVSAVRQSAPGGLAARVDRPHPADPLDAYRRSARLLFRQAAFTVAQTVLALVAFLAAIR